MIPNLPRWYKHLGKGRFIEMFIETIKASKTQISSMKVEQYLLLWGPLDKTNSSVTTSSQGEDCHLPNQGLGERATLWHWVSFLDPDASFLV
mmetsp:Transcript_9494/g.21435  ORF Transcript_9494/g.21435 Transcript_9494/m.21435 type:complete len:92 (+) Transcript_9494:1593-1868(+)